MGRGSGTVTALKCSIDGRVGRGLRNGAGRCLRPAVDIAGDAVGGAYSYRTAVDLAWLEDSVQTCPYISGIGYISAHCNSTPQHAEQDIPAQLLLRY